MDTAKLKNNKYYLGDYTKPGAHRGWFVGSFFADQHPCKTDKLEVLYTEHSPGDKTDPHYHKEKIEIIILLEGKARYEINGQELLLEKGNFLFVDINNIIKGEFLAPSKIFVIHSPSIPTDKILTGNKA